MHIDKTLAVMSEERRNKWDLIDLLRRNLILYNVYITTRQLSDQTHEAHSGGQNAQFLTASGLFQV